ncbi:MAG TPA: glycosyltransferase [Candidatus Rifleibacterium sp.]|nr:glycosyltransferase [Candidatus Rifleibacterium sp.]HPT48266.1 glycosyltransferase [Candidatus Rifleibacterium sp.]
MTEPALDLTIVVPTLNVKKTIRNTLESLAPLREAGARIIISDSYSDDGTLEAAAGLYDGRIDVARGNMYVAINAGIEAATTRWVCYLNADDIVFADVMLDALAKVDENVELIYGDIDFIDFFGRFLHGYAFPGPRHIIPLAASHICAISPIGTLYKKSLWERLHGFDTSYRYSADFDFLLRAFMSGARVHKIKQPTIGAFRLHGRQLSQNAGRPGLNENYQIVAKLGLKVPFYRRMTSIIRFKAGNFWEFLIRILRHRRLSGTSGFSECIAPPDYQK